MVYIGTLDPMEWDCVRVLSSSYGFLFVTHAHLPHTSQHTCQRISIHLMYGRLIVRCWVLWRDVLTNELFYCQVYRIIDTHTHIRWYGGSEWWWILFMVEIGGNVYVCCGGCRKTYCNWHWLCADEYYYICQPAFTSTTCQPSPNRIHESLFHETRERKISLWL